jgi:HEAT repeat protein
MKLKIFILVSVLISLFTNCYGTEAEFVKDLVPDAGKIVSAGLKSPQGVIRINAIEVVSSSKKMEFAPEVVKLLNDDMMPVRFAAAVAIGDMEYKGAEKQLRQLSNNSDLNIRIATAYALCKLGEMKHIVIIQKAADANDDTVKANAAMLLGKLKSTESLPVLYRLKDNGESSDAVAFNATEAIARIGDEKIYHRIWAMLISVYADDRCMGIYAMGALGGTRGINTILTMLDDDVVQVRLVAAEQLGVLGDKSGQLVVLGYLFSPPEQEKTMAESCNRLAALAIGQIGTEKLIQYLPKLLKNGSPTVQLAAAKSVFILAGRN